MPCEAAAPTHLRVLTALPPPLPEGLQHPSPAECIGDSPAGEAEARTVHQKKRPGKNTVLVTKSIYQCKNNCHAVPCSLGNRTPSRTKHAVGASGLLIIVRYVLQREGEPRGVVLHRAGIRNGSAPGCLPNALENLTCRGPPKDAFLLSAILFGGLLPRPGCTETNAGGKYSCLPSSLCNWYCCLLVKESLGSLTTLQIKASASSCHAHGAL